MTQEEWVYVADFQHNPSRKTAWTGLYYDAVAKASMVSSETPVDINDRHLITMGHDIGSSVLIMLKCYEDSDYSS
jgi:hypothetical protein